MQYIHLHKHIFKHMLLMWFVLFSLSPCSVKEVVFKTLNNDFTKTLNKSKTGIPIGSCAYTQNANQSILVVKKSKFLKQLHCFVLSGNLQPGRYYVCLYNHYSKTTSGNSPPMYILYKRLKIAVA